MPEPENLMIKRYKFNLTFCDDKTCECKSYRTADRESLLLELDCSFPGNFSDPNRNLKKKKFGIHDTIFELCERTTSSEMGGFRLKIVEQKL